ncbi:DUF4403 family protein [Marinoscillum sp. MHG1-6]|uniref:DUF4403 family protein n=1 Tax=Marinoscillum sp. MHG1-6 TaxID=2959627 RepID=UPI0021586D78|nr:DUF4403 family protein [Marinoscillum sp. MHG1-6]
MKNPNHLSALGGLIALICILTSCGERSRRLNETQPIDVPLSHLSFNIHFPIDQLEAGVNDIMKKTLVDDVIPTNNNGDKLFLKVVKKGDLKLSLRDGQAHASLPLSVEVALKKKMMGITFSNQDSPISFTGHIETISTASLDESWDFSLHCQDMTLIWDQEPSFNLFGINIDLTQTMEKALAQNEEKILSQLCSSVNESIDFKKAMNKIWLDIQNPIRIAHNPKLLWLYSRPKALNAELLPMENDTLSVHVEYKSTVHITTTNEVTWPIEELPQRGSTISDRSAIMAYLEAKMPFTFVEDILKEQYLGKTFEYEQYHATEKILL